MAEGIASRYKPMYKPRPWESSLLLLPHMVTLIQRDSTNGGPP